MMVSSSSHNGLMKNNNLSKLVYWQYDLLVLLLISAFGY